MILAVVQAPQSCAPGWLYAGPFSVISLAQGAVHLGLSGAASRYAGAGVSVAIEVGGPEAGRTDALAVAAAYRRFGRECVAHLSGRFRFLLHDSEKGEVLAASSTAPSWPWVYWSDSRTTVICSRLLPMLRCPDVPRSLNENYAAHLVMGLAAMPDGTTPLSGVRRLTPGAALVIDRHGPKVLRVDRLEPRELRHRGGKPADAFLEELAAAVQVAAEGGRSALSFSGGLDSATLAVAGLRRAETLRAYSFLASEDGATEVNAIRVMERALPALDVTRIDASDTADFPDLGSDLRDDPPLVPLGLLPARMQLWSRASADGFRTLIEGEGGDELFSALPTPVDALQRGRVGEVARHFLRPGGRRELIEYAVLLPLLPNMVQRAWLARSESMDAHLPAFAAWDARQHPLMREATNEFLASLVHRTFAERLHEWTSAPVVVGAMLSRRHVAGSFGVELEWPMLHREVLELVMGLHQERLLQGGPERRFLRDALEGIVPDEVRLAPKDVSLYRAFIARVLTSPRAREAVRDARVRARLADLVRFERVDAMLDGLAAGRALGASALWHLECLVSFAQWYAKASSEYGVD